jgi:hypothetical protein
MFERFTGDARELVKGAVVLAGSLGQSHVGPEHLAASLAPVGGVAAGMLAAHQITPEALQAAAAGTGAGADVLTADEIAALRSVGVDAQEVLRRIEQEFGAQPPPNRPASRRGRFRQPFRPESKRILEQSLRQAVGMKHRYLGTEHILLALLAQPNPDPATKVLLAHGLTYDTARAEILAA